MSLSFSSWRVPCAWLSVIVLLGLASCARLPSTTRTAIKATNLPDLQGQVQIRQLTLEDFRLQGPFDVLRRDDVEMRVDPGVVTADLFFASHGGRAPLVIIVHGDGASKELHAHQARHVASWGLHAMTLQLPNKGPWVDNARKLREVVAAIAQGQALSDGRIDAGKIILAGHSFGASSVAVALAEGARARGGILLDPATTERAVPVFLGRNKAPILIVGADEDTTVTTNRAYFFNYARARVYEVSVKDAIHEDAQFPADYGNVTEDLQITFAGALTSAAVSLALTGSFDYAWASFDGELKNGRLVRPRVK